MPNEMIKNALQRLVHAPEIFAISTIPAIR